MIPTLIKLRNVLGTIINPATEEKQDSIITAIGGIGGAIKYDSRLDDGATYMYVGEAVPGTANSSTGWRIKRYTQSDLTGLWADGTEAFKRFGTIELHIRTKTYGQRTQTNQ